MEEDEMAWDKWLAISMMATSVGIGVFLVMRSFLQYKAAAASLQERVESSIEAESQRNIGLQEQAERTTVQSEYIAALVQGQTDTPFLEDPDLLQPPMEVEASPVSSSSLSWGQYLSSFGFWGVPTGIMTSLKKLSIISKENQALTASISAEQEKQQAALDRHLDEQFEELEKQLKDITHDVEILANTHRPR